MAGFGRRNSRPRSQRRQPFELKTPATGHSKRTDFGASQTYPTPLQENPLDPYRTQFCPVVLIVAQHRLAESRGATQVRPPCTRIEATRRRRLRTACAVADQADLLGAKIRLRCFSDAAQNQWPRAGQWVSASPITPPYITEPSQCRRRRSRGSNALSTYPSVGTLAGPLRRRSPLARVDSGSGTAVVFSDVGAPNMAVERGRR